MDREDYMSAYTCVFVTVGYTPEHHSVEHACPVTSSLRVLEAFAKFTDHPYLSWFLAN